MLCHFNRLQSIAEIQYPSRFADMNSAYINEIEYQMSDVI